MRVLTFRFVTPHQRVWSRLCAGSVLVITALVAGGCVAHPKGQHGPACATIESATHIVEYPSKRFTILKQVAHRPLSQHEQTYLVNAIFQPFGLSSSIDQADTLIALMRNRCCTDQTRSEIREKLAAFTNRMRGEDQQRIVAVLDNPGEPVQPRAEAPRPAGVRRASTAPAK